MEYALESNGLLALALMRNVEFNHDRFDSPL